MNKTNLLRGITNTDLKQLVNKALQGGWQIGEMSGTTHMPLIWPLTGEKVSIGTTSSDRNAYKAVGRRMENISGLDLLPKHKHRKGRGLTKTTGYAETYRTESSDSWSKRIHQLLDEYEDLIIEFKVIASPGDTPRSEMNRAFAIIRRMAEIETFLTELKQPVPKFEPTLHFLDK